MGRPKKLTPGVEAPSPNGSNGHDAAGRFLPGNPGGPGNPHARRVAELRAALLDAVDESDVRRLVKRLIKAGNDGDVAAAKLVLAYVAGAPATEIRLTDERDTEAMARRLANLTDDEARAFDALTRKAGGA